MSQQSQAPRPQAAQPRAAPVSGAVAPSTTASQQRPIQMTQNPLVVRQQPAVAAAPAAPAPVALSQQVKSSALVPAKQQPVTKPAAPVTAAAAAAPTQPGELAPFVVDNIHYRRFAVKTRDAADNIAILKDKVIKLDYWIPSLEGKAFIALTSNNDKHLMISQKDYTTKVEKFSLVSDTNDVIAETLNSIYIVAKGMPIRRYDIKDEDFLDGEE